MILNITESIVTVKHNDKEYAFEILENDKIEPVFDEEIPEKIHTELNKRGFFICDYPQTFTWHFKTANYDLEDVLFDIPNGIIKEGSKEHESLYNLVAGDYGGVKVEITVGKSGVCKITGVKSDLPIKGETRTRM